MLKIGKNTNDPFLKFCFANRWADRRKGKFRGYFSYNGCLKIFLYGWYREVNSEETSVTMGVYKYSLMAGTLTSAVNSHILPTYIWHLNASDSIVDYVHSNHRFPFNL